MKYGELQPLVDVDFTPENCVSVIIKYQQKSLTKQIYIKQTVADFRKYLEDMLEVPTPNDFLLMYKDVSSRRRPLIMQHPDKMLYTYNIYEGDEFHIHVPKKKVTQNYLLFNI